MELYRIKLKPRGLFTHTWQADTIFGGLCWVMQSIEGEKKLRQFLADQKSTSPPLVLSNGFPGDLLPRPFLPDSIPAQKPNRDEYFKTVSARKEERKIKWLRLDEFDKIRTGMPFHEAVKDELTASWRQKALIKQTSYHNMISRDTETVLPDGLFAMEGMILNNEAGDYISIYAHIQEDWKDLLIRLLTVLGRIGLGGEKSTGKGGFELIEIEPFKDFASVSTPGGFVTLSDFVPKSSDPVDGFWSTRIKLGWLGGNLQNQGRSFKKPFIALQAGSCFKTSEVRPFYGRMVENIAPFHPEVVQYGLALPLAVHKDCFNF